MMPRKPRMKLQEMKGIMVNKSMARQCREKEMQKTKSPTPRRRTGQVRPYTMSLIVIW